MSRIWTRLTVVWHVLCGRPLVYRVQLTTGPSCLNLGPGMQDLRVQDCHLEGAAPACEHADLH